MRRTTIYFTALLTALHGRCGTAITAPYLASFVPSASPTSLLLYYPPIIHLLRPPTVSPTTSTAVEPTTISIIKPATITTLTYQCKWGNIITLIKQFTSGRGGEHYQ